MRGLPITFNGLEHISEDLKFEQLRLIENIMNSGHYMDGKYTREFEQWLAKKNNMRYALTCHSGTQALEIIAAYKRRTEEKVFIPNFTYPATANAFINAGFDVTLCDVTEDGLIDVSTRFGLVVAVGLHGIALTNKYYNYNLIEDGAQHWLANDCKRIGTTAISFDPTKNLAANGNGGAIITDDEDLYFFALDYRNNGKQFNFIRSGTNSRMSEIDCACLLAKTKYLDGWQMRRRAIAEYWIDAFKDLPVTTMINKDNIRTHALHKFVIRFEHRGKVVNDLQRAQIDARIHYKKPLSEYPAYATNLHHMIFKVAHRLADTSFSLPFYPSLSDQNVEYIANTVSHSVREAMTTRNSVSVK